jgi:hypothetical protein
MKTKARGTPMKPPSRGLIRPIDEADEPVTQLERLEEDFGVAAIVRAMDAGAPVYDAGGVLFASWSDVVIVEDLRKMTATAET